MSNFYSGTEILLYFCLTFVSCLITRLPNNIHFDIVILGKPKKIMSSALMFHGILCGFLGFGFFLTPYSLDCYIALI